MIKRCETSIHNFKIMKTVLPGLTGKKTNILFVVLRKTDSAASELRLKAYPMFLFHQRLTFLRVSGHAWPPSEQGSKTRPGQSFWLRTQMVKYFNARDLNL